MINKSKTIITPGRTSKGIGAYWDDSTCDWDDSFFSWVDEQTMSNKSKTSVTFTNKTKNNA